MSNMRQTNVRQLQHNLKAVMKWVDHGEEVQITRRNCVIARLIPDKPPQKKIKWPDFVGRARALVKNPKGPTLTEVVLQGREERKF